jgi:hypothetical protein
MHSMIKILYAPPVQWVLGLSPRFKEPRDHINHLPHLALMLKKNEYGYYTSTAPKALPFKTVLFFIINKVKYESW